MGRPSVTCRQAEGQRGGQEGGSENQGAGGKSDHSMPCSRSCIKALLCKQPLVRLRLPPPSDSWPLLSAAAHRCPAPAYSCSTPRPPTLCGFTSKCSKPSAPAGIT